MDVHIYAASVGYEKPSGREIRLVFSETSVPRNAIVVTVDEQKAREISEELLAWLGALDPERCKWPGCLKPGVHDLRCRKYGRK